MRLLALGLLATLVLAAIVPSVITPSFAQISPAITTTPSRPPIFLPSVYRAAALSTPTGTSAPPTTTQAPTATPSRTPTAQSATATSATATSTTPPTGPTRTPTLPPASFNNCREDPNPAAAPNYPIRIVEINKGAETVTLRNVTTNDTIDLAGWTMCSITGNQQHPISGTLAPGEERIFDGPSGAIWNNSLRDDGALYNPNGQLVSYDLDS